MTSQSSLQRLIRAAVLLSWLALFLLVTGQQVIPSFSLNAWLRALLFTIPLLAPLRGLIRGDRYTYSWATLCVLPYFICSVTEAVADPQAHSRAIIMLGVALLWFFALISYLRVSRTL
jgi:uncharacterized membrane protein